MKKYLLLMLIVGSTLRVTAQLQAEFSVLGENAIGVSAKIRLVDLLSTDNRLHFTHVLGIGHSLPPWSGYTATVNFGEFFGTKHFEYGFEATYSIKDPFFTKPSNYFDDEPSVIIYPQVQYHFGKKRLSYGISLGCLIPFWVQKSIEQPLIKEVHSGDVPPNLKFSVIYSLKK